tara:strand:+ start:1267 stop:1518 length:252 start_codon:yes stop_codon:yes gene_type:complete
VLQENMGSFQKLCLYIVLINKQTPPDLMSKKKRKKTIITNFQKVVEKQKPKKSISLVFGGILVAMSSIGLLIFVLSEKLFHLS